MKKTKCIFLLLLLCCIFFACGGGKTNVENTTQFDYTVFMEERRKQSAQIEAYMFEEKRLSELRSKVKVLFPEVIEYNQISPKYFGGLKFSNIIYESGGKIVRAPIFRGTMGDVLYNDLLKYCTTRGLDIVMDYGFTVKFNKGEFDKTLDEFKKFYGRHLAIDFNKEPILDARAIDVFNSADGHSLCIYDFVLDGVSGKLAFCNIYDEYKWAETELLYYIRIK